MVKRFTISIMLMAILAISFIAYWPVKQASANSIPKNIVQNNSFDNDLEHWDELPTNAGSYDVSVVSHRLKISLTDSKSQGGVWQAWKFDAGGNPETSNYTLADNFYFSADVLIDEIAYDQCTTYLTFIAINFEESFTLCYVLNASDAPVSNPLSLSNSSSQAYIIQQVTYHKWFSFSRNLKDDLQAVAPAYDPQYTNFTFIALSAAFTEGTGSSNDVLTVYFDNIVIGGHFVVTVYDVKDATITLDGQSQTIAGSFVSFVGITRGTHTLSTSPETVTDEPNGQRFIFQRWHLPDGTYRSTMSITIDVQKDGIYEVERKTQYAIGVASDPISPVEITVGSTVYYTPFLAWADKDSTVSIKAKNEIPGVMTYYFYNWYGPDVNSYQNPLLLVMEHPWRLTANYSLKPPDFIVSASPMSQEIYQGDSAIYSINVTSISGFSETVTLSAGTLPSGITATFTPSSGTVPFSSTLTIEVSNAATAKTYTINIVASGGGKSHGTSVTLNVLAKDFTITPSPSSISLYQGRSGSASVSIEGTGGFSDTVSLSLTVPSGITATISPSSGTPPFSATVSISTSSSISVGTYSIVVSGNGGGKNHTATISVTVTEPPPPYTVTVKTSGLTGLTGNVSTTVYVDGEDVGASLNDANPYTTEEFEGDTTHTIEVQNIVNVDENTRFVCADNKTTVSSTTKTVTFTYKLEYKLTFSVPNPANYTVTIKAGTESHSGKTPYTWSGWFENGKSVSFSVSPTKIKVGQVEYVFSAWKDQNNTIRASPITVSGPLTLTAYYAITGLSVTVYDVPGSNITFNGASKVIPDGGDSVVFETGNGTFPLEVSESVLSGNSTRLLFSKMTVGSSVYTNRNITLTIGTSSVEVRVERTTQYKIEIVSPYGNVSGSGWANVNSSLTISVSTPFDHGNGTRRVFIGWSGDYEGTSPSATITVDKPKTIIANWKTQYQLTLATQYGTVGGSGWYDAGSNASISATPPTEENIRYIFAGWSGDYTGSSPSATIKMDGPKKIVANWKRQFLVFISFIDGKTMPLTMPPKRVIVINPNGTKVQLNISAGKTWMDEGIWTLKEVNFRGVDVKLKEESFTPQPGASWKIQTKVYPLTVKVLSSLTGWAVQGATVSITLPDGSLETGITDKSGQVSFAQLPSYSYTVKVVKDSSSATGNIDLISDGQLTIKILPMMDLILFVGAPIGAGVCGIIFFLVFKRASLPSLKLPKLKLKKAAKTPPPPPPPEEEAVPPEKGEESIESWLQRREME